MAGTRREDNDGEGEGNMGDGGCNGRETLIYEHSSPTHHH